MRIIGLTGSIACGKSTVSRFLGDEGYPVVDGDKVAHALTEAGGETLPLIRQTFGDEYFFSYGELNRRKLGRLVFHDDEARARLDELMAPFLRKKIAEAIEEARDSGAALCFLDLPLLYEKGYDALCDTVWCVWLPEALQTARLMERDGYTEEEAIARIRAVMSSDEKAARAGFVLDNSGSVEETLAAAAEQLRREEALVSPTPVRTVVNSHGKAGGESLGTVHCLTHCSASQTGTVPNDSPVFPEAGGFGPKNQAMQEQPGPGELVMERPSGARRRNAPRKAAWTMPLWLNIALISLAAALAISFTGQCLMRAYLVRQAALHEAEQQAIDENYPLAYRELIETFAAEYNLRPAFVAAVIRNESSFRPMAESSVGARGLMQLMPDTAEWIAGKLRVTGYAFERMYDPEANIRFGCWYLNYLSKMFSGNPVCVISAYHAGQGTVSGWLSDTAISSDGVTLELERLPQGPTKTYAERVIRDDGIYEAKYFAPPAAADNGAGAGADAGTV